MYLRILIPQESRRLVQVPHTCIRMAKLLPQLELYKMVDTLHTEASDFQMADSCACDLCRT